MAITSTDAILWHAAPTTGSPHVAGELIVGRNQMRKIGLFAIVAAVVATGLGVWAASTTNARSPSMSQGIEPFELMSNAKELPTVEFADYTFVFRWALGFPERQNPMPAKYNASTTVAFRRRKHSIDPAMKAGIGATACSVLIVALTWLAMHMLPVSIG
jgi:hypothetical protein